MRFWVVVVVVAIVAGDGPLAESLEKDAPNERTFDERFESERTEIEDQFREEFEEIWMDNFLVLQEAIRDEGEGRKAEALAGYRTALKRYESMQTRPKTIGQSGRLSWRIRLIRDLVSTLEKRIAVDIAYALGVPPSSMRAMRIGEEAEELRSRSRALRRSLLPEWESKVEEELDFPENWHWKGEPSFRSTPLVPLIETPETRNYEKQLSPLLRTLPYSFWPTDRYGQTE